MPSKHIVALALSLSLAAPAAARAQSSAAAARPALTSEHFSVKAGLLLSSFSIDDDDDTEAGGGAGFEIQGRYTRDRLSLAVGLERTSHDVEDVKDDLSHRVFYVEPRLTFPQLIAGSSPKVLPYASARLGRSSYALEVNDRDYEASGWSYGVGGGILYEMSPSTQLDLGLTWSHAGFGDYEVDGDEVKNSDFDANSLALRVGVSYRFGRGGAGRSTAGKR